MSMIFKFPEIKFSINYILGTKIMSKGSVKDYSIKPFRFVRELMGARKV